MENVLTSPPQLTALGSRTALWIGRTLTGLVVAFLLLDALGKLVAVAPVIEGTRRLGYAVAVIRPLGVVLALSTLLHVIPRTQVLGALLLTAYLGGATATHVRVGTPFWFPVAVGVLLWAGFCLRNPRLRALVIAPSAS
jgi:hypothetical protein